MAETRRKSDQDFKIKRAARELGIKEETLRHLMNTTSDQELREWAIRLLKDGREIENVAQNLEINEATLHSWAAAEFSGWASTQAALRQREEELRRQPPRYLEDPPS